MAFERPSAHLRTKGGGGGGGRLGDPRGRCAQPAASRYIRRRRRRRNFWKVGAGRGDKVLRGGGEKWEAPKRPRPPPPPSSADAGSYCRSVAAQGREAKRGGRGRNRERGRLLLLPPGLPGKKSVRAAAAAEHVRGMIMAPIPDGGDDDIRCKKEAAREEEETASGQD